MGLCAPVTMRLGWSSHVYPLEAADFDDVPDYAGESIPAGELPSDRVVLLIRKGHPDSLVRGRDEIARRAGGTVDVRVVFVPSVSRWNLLGTLVRVCRNCYRYHGSHVYHISAKAVREMKLERTIRTTDNPQKRAGKDRAASMNRLLTSLRRDGYRDDKPIAVMLCRTGGLADSLRQGHHRVSACLECGVDRMAVEFVAAGVAPWQRWAWVRRLLKKPAAETAWRNIVDGVGSDMGLTGCRVVLENKYINDVFFEGQFKGRDAIVKCSSTCAWSIGNEFRLASRLRAAAPLVVPEPLAVWTSDDGHRAFVVTEKVGGPSLTDLLMRGVTEAQADGFASDILTLAKALHETGILHRDIYTDNFLLGADGHLKVIDLQMSIDRNDYREDPWVAAHPKFLYVVFGVNHNTPCGCWDDRAALDAVLALLPSTDAVVQARLKLAAMPDIAFTARPPLGARLVLGAYALSLMIQSHVPWRSRKRRNQARKRLDTIRARGGTDVDGRDPEAINAGKVTP